MHTPHRAPRFLRELGFSNRTTSGNSRARKSDSSYESTNMRESWEGTALAVKLESWTPRSE